MMVNAAILFVTIGFVAGAGGIRDLTVDSLELEMMELESRTETHQTEQIHEILGHHHDAKPNRDEMLQSVLQTGVFPKAKAMQDLTTDELVKDYIDQSFIFPKGRRKYENILNPNSTGQSGSKNKKPEKNVGTPIGISVTGVDGMTQTNLAAVAPTVPSILYQPTPSPVDPTTDDHSAAFLYESSGAVEFSDDELKLLSTVTNSVFMEMYSDFFGSNPDIECLATETSGYTSLGNNLFRFEATVLFRGSDVPSSKELQDIADYGLASGTRSIGTYLERLRSTGDPRLASIEGVLFLGSERQIEALSPQETRGNAKISVPTFHEATSDNEVKSVHSIDLVVLRTLLVVSMLLFTVFLVYMEARRQNTLLPINSEANIMKPREPDEPTYRTTVFSKGKTADVESFDEVSIGDESYSMTSVASGSPPTSPVRSETYLKTKQQPTSILKKPAWATRNRKERGRGEYQRADEEPANASIDEESADEGSGVIEMESASENTSTYEVEHLLSIPALSETKEHIIDNQDLANPFDDASFPGEELSETNGLGIEEGTGSKEKEEITSSAPSKELGEAAVEGKAPSGGELDTSAPKHSAVSVMKSSVSAGGQSTESILDDSVDTTETDSPEPEWMKKFKQMGMD